MDKKQQPQQPSKHNPNPNFNPNQKQQPQKQNPSSPWQKNPNEKKGY